MKFPTTIGGCLKLLAETQRKLDALAAQTKPLAEREAAIREHMLGTFKKDQLRTATGAGLRTSISQTDHPQVKDWAAFWKFATRKGNDDLVNRAVNSAAWRARLEAGKKVPGVEIFTKTSLRVSKVKEGKR